MLIPFGSRLEYPTMITGNQGIEAERALDLLAVEAYIYGYPLVLMDITRRTGLISLTQHNRFFHQKVLSTPKFIQVVRPNVDTLYSSAWLDLSEGPLLLHVPNTNNRYYLLPMLDAWSNVFASVGKRTSGTREQLFTIVGPGWQGVLPPDIPIIHAPTPMVWITGRTQTNGPSDYPAVHAIQRKYTLTKLHQPHKPLTHNLLHDHLLLHTKSPKDQVAAMDAPTFFNLMMELIYNNPPYPAIQSPEMTVKLQTLGLVPSRHFHFDQLPLSNQRALTNAIVNGPKVIDAAGKKILNANEFNGWSMLLKHIGNYGTDYMQRAFVAKTLFGANVPEDSVYAYDFADSSANALDGRNNYIIHFNPGQMPPANAFWSITLYNSNGFLVENAMNRYAISPHLGKLNYNVDGSLDILIQHAAPGPLRSPNWLPAPLGSFNLMLRMYWPQSSVLNGEWVPPVVSRS